MIAYADVRMWWWSIKGEVGETMRKCQLCGRPAGDEVYCGRCEKIAADVWMDLKREMAR